MNHPFSSNLHSLCSTCSRPELDHSDAATCECCPNIGSCELIGTILMCSECQARQPESIPASTDPRLNRITELVNKFHKEIPVDNRAFLVNSVTSIVDIEAQLSAAGADTYELAKLVETNLITERANIFHLRDELTQARINAQTDQKYLNQIVPTLRESARVEFAAYDITYKPTTALPAISKPAKPRSANEKAYQMMAKLLGVTVEQARMISSAAAKSLPCTCIVTPGICKQHGLGQ